MEVTIQNPRYSSPDQATLDVELVLPDGEVLPFTANPNDTEKHGREIWQRAQNGEFGTIQPYEAP
jgi:hypothetical protein